VKLFNHALRRRPHPFAPKPYWVAAKPAVVTRRARSKSSLDHLTLIQSSEIARKDESRSPFHGNISNGGSCFGGPLTKVLLKHLTNIQHPLSGSLNQRRSGHVGESDPTNNKQS
jgi:hypothetical protein